MKHRLRTTVGVGVAALLIVLALAACGGGGDSGGRTGTTATEDPQEAGLDFARCMRDHGVDVPDPDANGGIQLNVGPGDDLGKVERAQKACQPLLTNAAPKLTDEQRRVMQDAALAFARCMRDHGIDMPDPTFGAGGIVTQKDSSGRAGSNPDDPKFKAAQKACQPLMNKAARQAGLPTQGPSTGTSGGLAS